MPPERIAPSSDAESARAEIVSLLAAVSGSSITIVRTSAPSNLGEAETVVSNTTGSASSIITANRSAGWSSSRGR